MDRSHPSAPTRRARDCHEPLPQLTATETVWSSKRGAELRANKRFLLPQGPRPRGPKGAGVREQRTTRPLSRPDPSNRISPPETDDEGSSGPAQPASSLKTNLSPQDSTRASPPFSVARTDNRRRVRDEYVSSTTLRRAGTRDTSRYSVRAHSNAWSSTVPVRAHPCWPVRRNSACVAR